MPEGGFPSDGERTFRMRIDVVTLFPRFFGPIIEGSIIGRSQAKGIAEIHINDLWDHVPQGERADDAPYGGGPGMVLRLGPLVTCLESLLGPHLSAPPDCRIIVASPAGPRFDQAAALGLTRFARLIIICGHYEGIDERFFSLVSASELSLGDFVLTGGEIPALAFIDACIRLLPGAINPQSTQAESFREGRLDWPHYTRPATFRGLAVPEVLLSGDHGRIARWREDLAKNRTAERRPDLGSSAEHP
jgi:tRNA (guanine37-N1)-methyltransferase